MILNEISQKEKNNTPYESTYIANLKNETNKTEEKQSHRYREQTGGCQSFKGSAVGQIRWRGFRGTNFQLQNKSQGCNLYKRNTVNNTVITLYGDRWLLDLLWSIHNVFKC